MRIKERVLYDPRVRGYEIVFSIIGAVKIPVLDGGYNGIGYHQRNFEAEE